MWGINRPPWHGLLVTFAVAFGGVAAAQQHEQQGTPQVERAQASSGFDRADLSLPPTRADNLRSLLAVTANGGARVGVLAYCASLAGTFGAQNAAQTLIDDGRFGSVSVIDADSLAPTAETLRNNHDCVVAVTNSQCGIPMPDAIADSASSALAAFAASGRGVVLSAFDFAYRPWGSIGLGSAIFAPGLSPFQQVAPSNNAPAGAINVVGASSTPPCDRFVEGVTGPASSSFANNVGVSPGARLCVSYANGRSLVAVNAAGNVVGFNSFPFSATDQARPGYRRLFSNAVHLACSANLAVDVPVDIKPESCPNVWNSKQRGVLPVAILGTSLPVSQIDPESIKLNGVPPLRSSLEDVGSPYSPYRGKANCDSDCTTAGRDGLEDLVVHFDAEQLAATLPGSAGCFVLKLTGRLKAEHGGAAIAGEDVVSIRNPGK